METIIQTQEPKIITTPGPYRVHKIVKYREREGNGVGMGKVLKKSPGRYLVYILQGNSRGNRRWIEHSDVVEESIHKERIMAKTNIPEALQPIDKMIGEELALKFPPETGKSVGSASGLKIGDQVAYTHPSNKRNLVGIVSERDEKRKELVVRSNSNFADYAMGWMGQPVRIPFSNFGQWKVRKLA